MKIYQFDNINPNQDNNIRLMFFILKDDIGTSKIINQNDLMTWTYYAHFVNNKNIVTDFKYIGV